ncbi:hypothetical protein GINT2_001803 [Glugoides intestinalis]
MRLAKILINSNLIRCQVSLVKMYEIVEEFKTGNEDLKLLTNAGLKYENTLLNPIIGEPYKYTGFLSNLRFFGPRIKPGGAKGRTERSYPNDTSIYPLIKVLILLFPSPAGTFNHLCTHPDHLTKLFIESNPYDKKENASNLFICSITGESFTYTSKGINEDIKQLGEEKNMLQEKIDKNKVDVIANEIVESIKERTRIKNNLSVLNLEKKHTTDESELTRIKNDIKEYQARLKEVKDQLKELKNSLTVISASKEIEELNKKIKASQRIKEKSKKAFEELGRMMSKALKDEELFNPGVLLPIILHEFVKSAFTIEEVKEYMDESLIKINKKLSSGEITVDRLIVIDTQADWAAILVRINNSNKSFPYSRFNLPVSNTSVPIYIRGAEGYFDNRNTFPDCVEIAIMQLCNCLLFDPNERTCGISHLRNNALLPEIKDFYTKYSNPFDSMTLGKRNDWSKVVQDRPDLSLPDNNKLQTHKIMYVKDNRNEMESGVLNMMSVLTLIFGVDRELIFRNLNQGNILERFEVLLKALSAHGMKVKIENINTTRLKALLMAPLQNKNRNCRIEFFGKIKINFSYKDNQGNKYSTKMILEQNPNHTSLKLEDYDLKNNGIYSWIDPLAKVTKFKEFSFPSMIKKVLLMANDRPLPKGSGLEEIYASGLIESNRKRLEILEIIYDKMPKYRNEEGTRIFNSKTAAGENDWEDFVGIIEAILEKVPLEDQAVFHNFAPFLLHSEKHMENLNGMDLRQILHCSNVNLIEHWARYANEKGIRLRCLFSIDVVEMFNGSWLMELYKRFADCTDMVLVYNAFSFDNSTTWCKSMEKLSKSPNCSGVELVDFKAGMIKYFIDGAVSSDKKVLENLVRLKIGFNNRYGINYINEAIKNLPTLIQSLLKLTEITIENTSFSNENLELFQAQNLINLIKEGPNGRRMTINLIGLRTGMKRLADFVKTLECVPNTVKICIVTDIFSFSKEEALNLSDEMKSSKIDLNIFHSKNGIKRPIAFLDKLLDSADDFFIDFLHGSFSVKHKSVNDFLTTFDPLLNWWKWKNITYLHESPSTEPAELLLFLNALNACEDIDFRSSFLELTNKDDIDKLITEVIRRDKKVNLGISNLLIDLEDTLYFYERANRTMLLTLSFRAWLIRVRKDNMNAFINDLPLIYSMFYGGYHGYGEPYLKEECINKGKVLNDLDTFTIDLENKHILYISDKNFNTVLKVVKDIKKMFKKVYIGDCEFSEDQISELKAAVNSETACTFEICVEKLYEHRLALQQPVSDEASLEFENYVIEYCSFRDSEFEDSEFDN